MMHNSTDDSELEVRPDGAMPVQQRDDAASDSQPLQDPSVSSQTISITVSHDSSEHLLHVPEHATFGTLVFRLIQLLSRSVFP